METAPDAIFGIASEDLAGTGILVLFLPRRGFKGDAMSPLILAILSEQKMQRISAWERV